MATIRSSLSLYDGMTGPLQNIHRALGMVLDRLEAVRDAADAWDGLTVRLDSLDGRTVNNTLAVQAADALDGLEQFTRVAGGLDGSSIRTALLLDAEDFAFDREISGILSIDAVGAAGMYETFAEVVRDGVLENDLLLNTTGAVGKYEIFAEALRGGFLKNALLLDTAGAAEKYKTFAEVVRGGSLENALLLSMAGAADKYGAFAETVRDDILENALLLNMAEAVGKYGTFAEAVRDVVLENVLLLNMAEAVGKYGTFAEAVRDDVLENDLLLNTAGAVGKYEIFTEAIRDGAWENSLLLNTAGAVGKYEIFAEAIRDGAWENFLLLNTAGAVGKYEIFTEAIRDGVLGNSLLLNTTEAADKYMAFTAMIQDGILENALLLDTTDGLDAFSRFLGETAGNFITLRMDVDAPSAAFDTAGLAETWTGPLINMFFAAAEAVDVFAGECISAAAVTGGTFAALGDYIAGGFVVPFWNALASAANFVGNVFNDPAAAVKVLFYDMALTVVGYIRNMAGAIENVINKIPGVSVNITSGLDGFVSGLEQARRQAREDSGRVDFAQRIDHADYSVGVDDSAFNPPKMPALTENWGIAPIVSFDFGNAPESVYVAARTAGADTLDYRADELVWMRDLAERGAVNQFTTAQITVEQHNENYISKDTDLDGIMDAWAYDFAQRLDASGEGVHE